jgi:hypothetical protein
MFEMLVAEGARVWEVAQLQQPDEMLHALAKMEHEKEAEAERRAVMSVKWSWISRKLNSYISFGRSRAHW